MSHRHHSSSATVRVGDRVLDLQEVSSITARREPSIPIVATFNPGPLTQVYAPSSACGEGPAKTSTGRETERHTDRPSERRHDRVAELVTSFANATGPREREGKEESLVLHKTSPTLKGTRLSVESSHTEKQRRPHQTTETATPKKRKTSSVHALLTSAFEQQHKKHSLGSASSYLWSVPICNMHSWYCSATM